MQPTASQYAKEQSMDLEDTSTDPSISLIILLPQYLYFILFCCIFYKCFSLAFEYIPNLPLSKRRLLMITIGINIALIFLISILITSGYLIQSELIGIVAITWSGILSMICLVFIAFSHHSALSPQSTRTSLINTDHTTPPNWRLLDKLHITNTSITIYFIFQFLLCVCFSFHSSSDNYPTLFILTHFTSMLYILRDMLISNKFNPNTSTSTDGIHSKHTSMSISTTT